MKNLTQLTAVALVAVFTVATQADAALVDGQSVGVDLGNVANTPGAGAETNFLVIGGAVTSAATTDTAGGSTGGVTVSFASSGVNGVMGEAYLGSQFTSGGPATGATGVYAGDASVFSDASFNDGYFTNETMTLTFENLENGLTYTLLGLGTGGFTNTATFNINGGGVINSPAPLTYEQYTNYNGVDTANVTAYKLTGLSTDGAGNLQIVLDGTSFFGYSALHLTAHSASIPTPAALPVGLALLGLIAARRRRV